MIALYIGLALELPRPYWAMATVYIVSNPFVGATRSKALYRALGTMIGAAGAVLIVPPFVESPFLFSVIVALWTGTLLYLSMFDRSARSYVFLLAGYTLPLIALPAVTNPRPCSISRSRARRRFCSASRWRASSAARCFRSGSRRRSSYERTHGFATPPSTPAKRCPGISRAHRFRRRASGSRRRSTVSNCC